LRGIVRPADRLSCGYGLGCDSDFNRRLRGVGHPSNGFHLACAVLVSVETVLETPVRHSRVLVTPLLADSPLLRRQYLHASIGYCLNNLLLNRGGSQA
jgi:hypothetical protein